MKTNPVAPLKSCGWMLAMALALAAGWHLGLAPSPSSLAQEGRQGAPGQRVDPRQPSTILEPGELIPKSQLDVRCEVPGQATLLWVVPEGTAVQVGDKLAELDSSAIEAKIAEAKVLAAQSESQLGRARTQLEAVREQLAHLEASLEIEAKLLKLTRGVLLGVGGELEQQIRETEQRIAVATAELELAGQVRQRQELDQVPTTEIKLAETRARAALELAQHRLKWLQGPKRELEEARLDHDALQARLKQSQLAHEARQATTTAEGELKAAEVSFQLAVRQLKQLEAQLTACQILAPAAGTVVYAQPASGRTAGPALEAGSSLRQFQTFLRIVDTSQLALKARVNETQIHRVRPGQPAHIRIEAVPDQRLAGKVLSVSRVPEPAAWYASQVKSYAVVIELEDVPRYARAGMTASVEIDASSP